LAAPLASGRWLFACFLQPWLQDQNRAFNPQAWGHRSQALMLATHSQNGQQNKASHTAISRTTTHLPTQISLLCTVSSSAYAHRQIFTIVQKASGRKPKLDDDMERFGAG
jgi:hypothetical protein